MKHYLKVSFYVLSVFLTPMVFGASFMRHYGNELAQIPHVQLAQLPTPVERATGLERILRHENIFIKRDDLTGHAGLYGGNKVRKLEFLLGDALRKGAKKIVTFGCTGTNHGLATACYAQQLGLECLLLLRHQPNSFVVRQNLLLDHFFCAEMKLFPDSDERKKALDDLLNEDSSIYFFPTGGSIVLGVLGFVNAAFELKEQIKKGLISEPDYIYVPIGSCGTTAGLVLGCVLAGIQSKIVAVAVEPEETADEFAINTRRLFTETYQLLCTYSSKIPVVDFPEEQFILNKDFCGPEYGVWLPAGDEAMRMMNDTEGIFLEGTYSAKALAALIADIRNQIIDEHATVLFWNTYCGLDFSELTKSVDYRELSPEVHSYFEDASKI